MTHRQALQVFPDTSSVSLYEDNKINGSREVAVTFNFISERTVEAGNWL
jgi:hypothetical protein